VRLRGQHVVVLVCVLGVTACGGAGPDHAAPDPTTPSESATVTPGPLEEYLGWTGPASTDQYIADIVWRENRTSACMAEQGFEYWPVVPAPRDVTQGSGPVSYDSAEFVAEYGYGVWTGPDSGFTFSSTADGSANHDYRAAMSRAGAAAYDEALAGPETGDGTGTREGGCLDAWTDPQGDDAKALSASREDAIAFLDGISGDPRIAEVDAAWASCLADQGYSYANPPAAQDSVYQEYAAAAADGNAPPPDVVAAGNEAEVRLATADHACRASTDWTRRHRAIELELQQEYVDAHRADLDALVASIARPSGG
jgi:hypothetical protein